MEEKRIVKLYVSAAGKKITVESPTLTQNATNAWIYFYSEKKFVNIECAFRGTNGKNSPTYHFIYLGKADDDEIPTTVAMPMYKYILNIPAPVLSFVMPAPSAKISVGFTCYDDLDGNGYLRTTTVGDTLLTVNRSDNSQILDTSYNASDVSNLWIYVGQLADRIDKLEQRVDSLTREE